MTNTADLRAAAEAATPGPWKAVAGFRGEPFDEEGAVEQFLGWDVEPLEQSQRRMFAHGKDARYIALASPDRILGILLELERKTEALLRIYEIQSQPDIRQVVRAALEGKP